MAEIFVPDGSWTFDGEILRIVPGGDRSVHELRKLLGELTIPLAAVGGVSFEPSRKGGSLQLRLRPGADPLADTAAGRLLGSADPYRLAVPKGRTGAAEYLCDEVRACLGLEGAPGGPCASFLLPGPAVPVSASAGDGTVSFDGHTVRLDWTVFAKSAKQAAGPQTLPLAKLTGVEWVPQSGLNYGRLRFHVEGALVKAPEEDPLCVSWGMQRYGGATVLVAAAVLARLPSRRELPEAAPAPDPAPAASDDREALLRRVAELEDQDAVLRRLGELGELHRSGVLTEEEFSAAKQAMLRRLGDR
ncbi:DUF4429 domain-containing protein [Microtetraspora niveoalba]|uniref:DUF4429 domain-containing protein n=1 Tax=Microtetraspora niveoalba TaxID=46175 RepID=UPI00083526D1|nr:DUF4429 domain-containing protein [Microtetraspora niveoalba]